MHPSFPDTSTPSVLNPLGLHLWLLAAVLLSDPCTPTQTDSRSWGSVKAIYR